MNVQPGPQATPKSNRRRNILAASQGLTEWPCAVNNDFFLFRQTANVPRSERKVLFERPCGDRAVTMPPIP
jgi:hypothetical protein